MKQKWALDELIDVWTLSSNELALVNRGKADHNRLGCAVLLKYFQIEGRFPRRQHDVPQTAIENMWPNSCGLPPICMVDITGGAALSRFTAR